MKQTNDLQMKELLKAIQDVQAEAAFTTDGLTVGVIIHNDIDRDGSDSLFITVDITPYDNEDNFAFYQFKSFEDNLNKLEELKARINSKINH